MGYAREMLENSPGATPLDAGVLAECIEACFACEQVCTACADACVGERNEKELVACIRLDLACADVCGATGRTLSRELAGDPGMAATLLQACARACALCAGECEKHAGHMEHCRICAEACRRCEEACNRVLEALA
jgi:hypothetical protein